MTCHRDLFITSLAIGLACLASTPSASGQSLLNPPYESGFVRAHGGIENAVDNPALANQGIETTGGYGIGNQGSNANGSWESRAGGEFYHRGVAAAVEASADSFDSDTTVTATGTVDYVTSDVLTFSDTQIVDVTFAIHGEAASNSPDPLGETMRAELEKVPCT